MEKSNKDIEKMNKGTEKTNKDNEKMNKDTEKISKNTEEKTEKTEKANKSTEKVQYSAIIMLIIALTVFIVSLRYLDALYKTYKMAGTTALYKGIENRDNENDTLEQTQKLMNEIENIYETCYVGDIERVNIDEYVLNALIQAYGDKYAVYRDPEDSEETSGKLMGYVSGIGVLLRSEYNDNDTLYDIYLMDVYDDSPAEKAGLKAGDMIVGVNGKTLDYSKYTYTEATNDIPGEVGTSLMLTVKDGKTGEIKEVEVIRDKATINTVRYQKINDEVGYIKIRNFDSETDEEFIEAINYFGDRGINKFIFDVRSNNGGLKEAVLNMLDNLIGSGILIYELDSDGKVIDTYKSDALCTNFSSVTLINGYTASAAELFTKCLSDYNLTTIIGETSFGKGTVCTTFPLSNGGSVMVSTGRYLTKSKENIEGVGIEPDIELKLSREKEDILYKLSIEDDDLIQRAIQELQKQ